MGPSPTGSEGVDWCWWRVHWGVVARVSFDKTVVTWKERPYWYLYYFTTSCFWEILGTVTQSLAIQLGLHFSSKQSSEISIVFENLSINSVFEPKWSLSLQLLTAFCVPPLLLSKMRILYSYYRQVSPEKCQKMLSVYAIFFETEEKPRPFTAYSGAAFWEVRARKELVSKEQ